MTRIAIKRVYEPATDTDGLRVLVDKLWPRGIRKEALHYDLWAKEIAPSAPLRRWFHADPQGRWEEFRRRYLHELAASPAVRAFVARIEKEPRATVGTPANKPGKTPRAGLRGVDGVPPPPGPAHASAKR